MIMEIETTTPILFLPVIDDCPDDLSLIRASATPSCVAKVHDASLELIVRLCVSLDGAIVSL